MESEFLSEFHGSLGYLHHMNWPSKESNQSFHLLW